MWIVFMCLGITSVLAQKITVTGKVMDGAMEGEPLPFASVVLLHPKDSTQASGIQSGEDGKFKLPSVKAMVRLHSTHSKQLSMDALPTMIKHTHTTGSYVTI